MKKYILERERRKSLEFFFTGKFGVGMPQKILSAIEDFTSPFVFLNELSFGGSRLPPEIGNFIDDRPLKIGNFINYRKRNNEIIDLTENHPLLGIKSIKAYRNSGWREFYLGFCLDDELFLHVPESHELEFIERIGENHYLPSRSYSSKLNEGFDLIDFSKKYVCFLNDLEGEIVYQPSEVVIGILTGLRDNYAKLFGGYLENIGECPCYLPNLPRMVAKKIEKCSERVGSRQDAPLVGQFQIYNKKYKITLEASAFLEDEEFVYDNLSVNVRFGSVDPSNHDMFNIERVQSDFEEIENKFKKHFDYSSLEEQLEITICQHAEKLI
jgi:hypothetical protein